MDNKREGGCFDESIYVVNIIDFVNICTFDGGIDFAVCKEKSVGDSFHGSFNIAIHHHELEYILHSIYLDKKYIPLMLIRKS